MTNGAYIYGVVAFLATGVCVFFVYKKKSSQALNKEQVKEEKQQPIKLSKRRYCFRYEGEKNPIHR